MSREIHVRFCEGLGVQFPRATRLVLGFQHRSDAERFQQDLQERMQKFGLALHPDKTRLIEFGRFAAANRHRRGQGKPETFDFLGFTHYCGRTLRGERFIVWRKTIAKRLRSKLSAVKHELMRRRHQPLPQLGGWLRSVVRGFFQYHAVPGNRDAMKLFRREVARAWLHALRRRSQRHRQDWNRFGKTANRWLPPPRILHPYPNQRFYAKHPR
jgi:RNA-directed DNA polymerase